MHFRKALLAAVAVSALCSQAFGSSLNLGYGTLNDGQLYEFGEQLSTGSSFIDTVSFHLGSISDFTSTLVAGGISDFTATIGGGTFTSPVTLQSGNVLNIFDNLGVGNYTMTFSGLSSTGFSNHPGIYGTFFSVAAVPEPETWLMLVIGLGLVGFQLRRKQKVLRPRQLVAG